MARSAALHRFLVAGVAAIWLASPAAAQTDDNSRAVRIIEEPPAGSAPVAPPPALAAPSPPTPALQPPTLQPPAARPPSPEPPAAALVAPSPSPGPGPAGLGAAPPPNLKAMQALLKAKNPAGIAVEILPRTELNIGEKIALRVATRKQGYLVLVDVDATGKLTQIYPNRRSLLAAQDGQENVNLIKPGRPVTIPEIGNPYAGFEFVAAPPAGVAMVVAILSDRPVQVLDLPDVPPSLIGQGGAISYLTDWTRNLRIASADASGRLEEATWSFDAKLYVIR
jgi:hypothetical protein